MSSTLYANQDPSPAVNRRLPTSMEDTGNNSQRTTDRRSLSDRFRNIFGRDSSSSNRTTSNDRRPPATSSSMRQGATTPTSGKSSTDTPQLKAPIIQWPFGKKKSKTQAIANTPKTSKKKIKANQKRNQTSVLSSLEISTPIYQQENQRPFQGEIFPPRTPEQMRGSSGYIQTSTNPYEATSAKGFRDYIIIDQSPYSSQVVVPNVDEFTPTYTSDRSRSPSIMNRQRLPNTGIERSYYYDNSSTTVSAPFADIEIIPTPQNKRRVADTSPSSNTRIVTEKPPVFPQTPSRPSSTIVTNPAQWKNTSSSTLDNAGTRSPGASSMDVSAPRLNAPLVTFGGKSSKKKPKRTKSPTRADGMSSSSSTINNLAQQNPLKPDRSWTTTYGSLPDAEILYGGSTTSLKPSKPSISRYPGLSAIVQHHLRLPPPVYQNERPYIPPTTTGSPERPRRFETSTTTLNEYEQNQSWAHPMNNGSTYSPSSKQRHDGYIRPMTPPKPPVQPDIGVIRVDIDDLRRRSPPPRPPRYDTPDPPTNYRSSTTIYTRDKHQRVDGGEIRTWSSRENNVTDDYNSAYRSVPYIHVQVDFKREPQTSSYDHQVLSPKVTDYFTEYRYSPRAHEQEHIEREQKIITDQEIHQEEKYEVSYEYEQQQQQQQQHQQYSYQTKSNYDQLHTTNRYSNDNDDDQNLTYANLTSSTRSTNLNERDRVYDQPPRSYSSNERIQEPLQQTAPVHYVEEIPQSYTLKRSDSYDGLGISISANSETRSNHFIRDVERGSPGHRAGLRKDDRIISINGINVENLDFSDVLILIKQGLDNDNLQLSVIHELEQI